MNDPIVNDIHRARDKILNECDNDIEKMINYIRQREVPQQ